MNGEKNQKKIHVLIFESESYNAIQELSRRVSRILPPKVNILSYQVDDGFFRLVLAGLREGAALTRVRKK